MEFNRAWLTTNRSCNLRCEWCYAKNANSSSMNINKAKECIELLHRMGVKTIVLIGGEPTIYSHFFEIINYVKQYDMRVAITTNGVKFSDMCFSKTVVDLGVSSINISLKATSEEDYISQTRDVGLSRAIEGYHNLVECGFQPTLSYVVTKYDENEFNELTEVLVNNKLQNILIQFVKPVIEKDSSSTMKISSMAESLKYIYNKFNKSNISYVFELSFPFCSLDKTVLEDLLEKRRIASCCHVQSRKGIVLDTDFKILPCNHFVNLPYFDKPIEFHESSIIEIFDSKVAEIFRNKARSFPSINCQKCSQWDICGGGCFTRWLFHDPKIEIVGLNSTDN